MSPFRRGLDFSILYPAHPAAEHVIQERNPSQSNLLRVVFRSIHCCRKCRTHTKGAGGSKNANPALALQELPER